MDQPQLLCGTKGLPCAWPCSCTSHHGLPGQHSSACPLGATAGTCAAPGCVLHDAVSGDTKPKCARVPHEAGSSAGCIRDPPVMMRNWSLYHCAHKPQIPSASHCTSCTEQLLPGLLQHLQPKGVSGSPSLSEWSCGTWELCAEQAKEPQGRLSGCSPAADAFLWDQHRAQRVSPQVAWVGNSSSAGMWAQPLLPKVFSSSPSSSSAEQFEGKQSQCTFPAVPWLKQPQLCPCGDTRGAD